MRTTFSCPTAAPGAAEASATPAKAARPTMRRVVLLMVMFSVVGGWNRHGDMLVDQLAQQDRLTLVRCDRAPLRAYARVVSESIPSHAHAICRLIRTVRDPICRHPNKLGIRGLHADRPDPGGPRRCAVRSG